MEKDKKVINKAQIEIVEFDQKDDIVTISLNAGSPWEEEDE